MESRASLLIWRVCAALFFGAFLALGATALVSPAGDVVPARFAQDAPEESSSGTNFESSLPGEAPDPDRPANSQTDDLPRMVGTPPNVDVEVLSDTSDSSDAAVDGESDGDGAGDVGQTEPASQVVATPKFTG